MTAAQSSITGYTVIPAGERLARPDRRRFGTSWWERALANVRSRREVRRTWEARVAAETASTTVRDPRDAFTVRHAGDERPEE